GELGEVVGRAQDVERALPVGAVHEVVEVRDDVVHRAAADAERRAAVHAARGLDLGLVLLEADDELAVVLEALLDGQVALLQALVLHEAGERTHRFVGLEMGRVSAPPATWPAPTSRIWPAPARWCRRPGPRPRFPSRRSRHAHRAPPGRAGT